MDTYEHVEDFPEASGETMLHTVWDTYIDAVRAMGHTFIDADKFGTGPADLTTLCIKGLEVKHETGN